MDQRKRTSEQSRNAIVRAAFGEIYAHGYQGARVERILARTGLSKGAFYHHFDSKRSLAYAVLEEVIGEELDRLWGRPLMESDDPLRTIGEIIEFKGDSLYRIELGCPINNLAQEMSPVDEGMRLRIRALFDRWRELLTAALTRGQRNGRVSETIDPAEVAIFIVGSVEGCIGLAKNASDPVVFGACRKGLLAYLEGLRQAAS